MPAGRGVGADRLCLFVELINLRREETRPFVRGAARAAQARGCTRCLLVDGPDLCPWSYRHGGGQGALSLVFSGEVCIGRDLSGAPDEGTDGASRPRARPLYSRLPLSRQGGRSGQEEAMVNAGVAACAACKDRPRALPLLFNLCPARCSVPTNFTYENN